MRAIDPATANSALWFYLAALGGWFISAGTRGFLRLYTYLDTLPPRKPRGTTMSERRPRPLRIVATTVGGVLALLNGLVGAGLLTTTQGDAVTAVVNTLVTALAAFGVVLIGERKVTPLSDPRNAAGQPLTPAENTDLENRP